MIKKLKRICLFLFILIILIIIFGNRVEAKDFFDNDYDYHGDCEPVDATVEPLMDAIDSIEGYNDITQIFITTENNETPNHDEYINASMSIKADNITGIPIGMEYTTGKIKVRGNSTSGLDKKPYNIKFDSKVEILGFSKGKKYCLLANRYDKSFLRNYLAFTLSKESCLSYTPSFRFSDVWLNGKYIGNYLITTPIEVSKTRLNIDTDGYDVLFERDAGRVEADVVYITSPKMNVRLALNDPEEPSEDQLDHMKSTLGDIENILSNASQYSLDDISNYVDIDSFIDFYLISEFFKNRDVHVFSTRFYLKDNKLYAGPCWDFDLCAGNFPEESLAPYTDIYALTKDSPWIYSLMSNEEFKTKLINRYAGLQYAIQKLPYYDLESIDYKYRESFKRDKDVAGWGYFAQGLDRVPESTHKANVAFLKNWLINRNNWLSEYFGISKLDYSTYYDAYYKTEILASKYEDIANDTDIQYALSVDSSVFHDQQDIDNYTNILYTAINKYPDEVYEDINDNAIIPVIEPTTETIDIDGTYSITYDLNTTYNGQTKNKASNYNLYITDKTTGKVYDSKDIKLKVKNGKNTGKATISIKSVKGIKKSNKIFKDVKITTTILPLKINTIVDNTEDYTTDGNLIIHSKGKTISKIYALVKRNNKIKKLKVTSYHVTDNKIVFSGNYSGTLYVNFNIE